MKVIFIVQGEGRGHLTQAIAMERLLTKNGYHVTEVLVGKSLSKRLPGFFTRSIQAPVKQFSSPNFLPTRANTRANIPYSLIRNLLKLPEYVESMRFIHQRIKKSEADIVINFYELLTGFTYFLYRPAAPLVCIGHQYLFQHKDFHLPTINKTELFFQPAYVTGSIPTPGFVFPLDEPGQETKYLCRTASAETRCILPGCLAA